MKINEVEQLIGITKKNIRFYEQEGLLHPCRSANGYRDYSEEDLSALQQIKLLRKLDIPIGEIKHMRNGDLTLNDCLRRHLIVLERRSRNLEAVHTFCRRLLTDCPDIAALDAKLLLQEMEDMEKGGTRFVNIQKRDHQKRKRGALIGAFSAIAIMALLAAIIIYAAVTEPDLPYVLAVSLAAFPVLAIVGTAVALKERIKEIEGGELDEASKY